MIRRGALATFRGAAAASRGARGNNSSKAWFSSTAVPEQERENEQNNKVASSSKAAPKARQSPAAPLKFDMDSFPSLLDRPDPVLDSGKAFYNEPSSTSAHKSSVIFYNSPRYFEPTRPTAASLILSGSDDGGDEVDSAAYLSTVTPLTSAEVNNLYRHTLTVKRVVRMTGKGKQPKMASLVVAGNGRGLVGYGEGKDLNAGKASRKAFHEAVKTLDYVERYDGRTIPAEVRGKWGATTVTLRPRPAGFGLQVPPSIHAIARSCGISDLSASILGSTNPYNVVKATLQLLWGGTAPLGLGDGIGGAMRRKDRGVGMRTVRDIEMARGRRLREVPQN